MPREDLANGVRRHILQSEKLLQKKLERDRMIVNEQPSRSGLQLPQSIETARIRLCPFRGDVPIENARARGLPWSSRTLAYPRR